VTSLWARLAADKQRNEICTLDQRENEVRIFKPSGMEVYKFGDDSGLASPVDLAVHEDGDIFVLDRKRGNLNILRLDYRGNPVSEIKLKPIYLSPKIYLSLTGLPRVG
jgi:hypothetical protein